MACRWVPQKIFSCLWKNKKYFWLCISKEMSLSEVCAKSCFTHSYVKLPFWCHCMMIMSHRGISVVINVRLYDSQDELKTGERKKTCPEFYIINPYTSSDCELHAIDSCTTLTVARLLRTTIPIIHCTDDTHTADFTNHTLTPENYHTITHPSLHRSPSIVLRLALPKC